MRAQKGEFLVVNDPIVSEALFADGEIPNHVEDKTYRNTARDLHA